MRLCLLALLMIGCGPKVAEQSAETGDDARQRLEDACRDGCPQLEACGVPATESPPECPDGCIELWMDCPAEAAAYVSCAADLDCDEFHELYEDPRLTACKDTFEAAQAACSF